MPVVIGTNGDTTGNPASVLSSVNTGSQVAQGFLSQEIDFTTPANGFLIIPAQAGYYPRIVNFLVLVTQAAGTQTAGPLLRAGHNVAHTNVMGLQAASAYSNAAHAQIVTTGTPFVAGIGVAITAGAAPGEQAPYVAGVATLLDVATGSTGTGGYVFKGKIQTTYVMMPV